MSRKLNDLAIREMLENLLNEDIKQEISAVSGVDVEGDQLWLNESFKVRNYREF